MPCFVMELEFLWEFKRSSTFVFVLITGEVYGQFRDTSKFHILLKKV